MKAVAYCDHVDTHYCYGSQVEEWRLKVPVSLRHKLAAVSAIEESVACAEVHHQRP